ncbi:hypothetical protein MASR2M44_24270 [Bacteroidota bacterium]
MENSGNISRLLRILTAVMLLFSWGFGMFQAFFGDYTSAGLSFLMSLPVLVMVYWVQQGKNQKALGFILNAVLIIAFLLDTGFKKGTGEYLYLFPYLIGSFLYEYPLRNRSRIAPLLLASLVILLCNLGWSPQLALHHVKGAISLSLLFYINLSASAIAGIFLLYYFSVQQSEMQLKLQKQQDNYSALIEQSRDQIWSIDKEFNLLSFNKNYEGVYKAFWGHTPKIGMNIMADNKSNPAVYEYWLSLYERALAGTSFREVQSYEYGGVTHFLEFSFVPVYTSGAISSIVVSATDITEQKTREHELQLYAESLNLLLSSTGDIIFEMNELGICERVWHAEEVELVDDVSYFIGKSVRELFDNPFKIRLGDQFNQVIRTGQSKVYEYSHPFQGSLHHYSCKLRIIRNSQPSRVAIVLEDISYRKEIEINQARQTLFLNKLIDHIPLGIYVKNVAEDFKYTLWNRELELMFGLMHADVIGRTDEDLFHNEGEISDYIFTDKLVAEQGETLLINKLNVSLGDKRIIARSFKIPVFNSEGKTELIIGILENITDFVQAQQNLELAEMRWQYALSGSRDAVWDINLETREVYFSPLLKKMLGYLDHENPELVWEEIIHPDDFKHAWKLYQDHIQGKTPYYEAEYRFKKKNGDYIWILDRGKVAEVNEEGFALRIIGTFQDISYRKHLEEQLINAKEKAEEASRAKSNFLSTMSHEIRTPMNAVNGIIKLLLQEKPQEHQLENLNALLYSSEQLMFLLNDILDFSKIDAGKLEKDERNFKPEELFRNSVQTMSGQAFDKAIKLSLDYRKPAPEFVFADRHRIGQIVGNLLSNAVKFTEEGQVEMRVAFVPIEQGRYLLRVEVEDTGIGIEAAKLDSIFELFTQASSETTRKFGGTGLGLAISKKLTEWLGGELKVESTPGIGTRFWFEIPVREGSDDLATMRSDEKPDQLKPLSGMRILVVEDNRMNTYVLSKFLSRWEIKYDVAEQGLQALDLLSANTYDLVLMDIQMPEMDGYETTRQLRLRGLKMPVFALTANVFAEVKEKVFEAGMNDYISKPFNPTQLYTKISSVYKDPRDKKPVNLTLF